MVGLYRKTDRARELAKRRPQKELYRSEFRQDYGRLIHSSAFRRLVGKTQLFPGIESDFFRNRLTHSLEVAQVAKSIANKLNYEQPFLKNNLIDTDLVETAALAHDLGHPPFGHNGEHALDECMMRYGGFEGNAQSLRILSRLEKKATNDESGYGIKPNGEDCRFGLNLSFRTLAAILKYDDEIPKSRTRKQYNGPKKGYYASERELVDKIKTSVTGGRKYSGQFKVLECWVMDLSDDIAYSTYDLEDAFKAGFLTPLDLVSASNELLDAVVDEMPTHLAMTRDRVRGILIDVFYKLFDDDSLSTLLAEDGPMSEQDFIESTSKTYRSSKDLADVGYFRTELTAKLVGEFIQGVRFQPNRQIPALSRVYLEQSIAERVEVLKRFSYVALIMSPRLKVAELRGKQIVKDIFSCLQDKDGCELLPKDYRIWHDRSKLKRDKMRVICDFIAGMTDRYAVEFFSRLKSDTPQSIFKPI